MYCKKCGNKIRKDAKFCNKCGEPVQHDSKKKDVFQEESLEQKENWGFWGRYKLKNIDLETAEKHIRNVKIVTFIFLASVIFLVIYLSTDYWIDVVIISLLLVGLYKKNTLSAIGLLVYAIVSKILQIIDEGLDFWSIVIPLIILHYFYLGALGVIKYNKLVGKKESVKKKVILGIIIGIVITALLVYSSYFLEDDYLYSIEDDYTSSILNELEFRIQPIGHFDAPDLFDSETISDEEWFSHLVYYDTKSQEYTPSEYKEQIPRQREIFSSVVKIVCTDSDYFYYGSGTNFDEAGYILTNHHVIVDTDECVVGFPDPETGLIREAYWATAIIDKDDITGHDLAYLSIEKPFFDENLNVYGYYEKISSGLFPYFEATEKCSKTSIQLGDELLVIGYPPLSGGALTITDGLVSSLYSQSGYIITSAKIISGNSGGLAIDKQGCYIGVPTAVYYEENDEFLGEIIDGEFVDEFDEAVADDLDEYINAY